MATYLPIILSVLSLIVAGTGLFFQHIRTVDSAVLFLSNFAPSGLGDALVIEAELTVSNAGTRAIMVSQARLEIRQKMQNGMVRFSTRGSSLLRQLPIFVPKGEFTHVALRQSLSKDELKWHLERGDMVNDELEFWIPVLLVTPSGRRLAANVHVATYRRQENGWAMHRPEISPIKLGSSFQLPQTWDEI